MDCQQENIQGPVFETRRISIKLRTDLFKEMIADSRIHPREEETKILNSKTLNKYIAKELSAFEKESIKIIHKTSLIKNKKERSDSKYFIAYGNCGQTTQCKVNYAFLVQDQPEEMINEYVEIQVDVKGI